MSSRPPPLIYKFTFLVNKIVNNNVKYKMTIDYSAPILISNNQLLELEVYIKKIDPVKYFPLNSTRKRVEICISIGDGKICITIEKMENILT